ncbi:MAG: hypothetical protein ACR2PX_21370 [Endozoicomonas sp.]|uniref:hypothetical protein n=1 Tax=Endozoicomonas sp. TaxID=1892382 RepID=UPI003D9B1DFE
MVYRIAVLNGDTARLSACSVRECIELSAVSFQIAVAEAERLNGVVIGWRQAL